MDTWTEPYVEAFKSLNEDKTVYQAEQEIHLNNTADTEPWEPDTLIRGALPNFDQIEVKFVKGEKDTTYNEINKKLREAKGIIGLDLLGPSIDRFSTPLLITLTTEYAIYAFDPNDEKSIKFLDYKLSDSKLEFWLVNGLHESDCLYHKLNINLMKAQARIKSCCGVHMQLMEKMSRLTEPARFMFPDLAHVECWKKRAKIERLEKLVETWLDIPERSLYFNKSSLLHLKSRPLNLTATNILKKRCALIRPLAQTLSDACWAEARAMSRLTFSRLLNCDDELKLEIARHMRENIIKKQVDIGYIMHLNVDTNC